MIRIDYNLIRREDATIKDDFIRRRDALKAFDNNIIDGAMLLARWAIEKVPAADVVHVVRCKDCKYFLMDECLHGIHGNVGYHARDYYCADGERREAVNDGR